MPPRFLPFPAAFNIEIYDWTSSVAGLNHLIERNCLSLNPSTVSRTLPPIHSNEIHLSGVYN